MSHATSKPVYAIWEQQRRRSVCASAESDQHLCCSLPRQYNILSIYIGKFMTLASFFKWADRLGYILHKKKKKNNYRWIIM